MFEQAHAFSGISVDDIEAARRFYAGTLGLDVQQVPAGLLIRLPGGAELFVYGKPDHEPATFTVLNFAVPYIGAAVDALNAAGVATKIYDDPRMHTDERGIQWGRAAGRGPDIAWFRDPAGNILSVLQDAD